MMQISAIQKLTLLDFPGRTACTVFTPGCNFRCGYCHNAEFVLPEKIKKISADFIPEEAVFNFLKKRQGLLDGICITGGEPTLQVGLSAFLKKVRRLGFKIKLDTNGSMPKVVRELFYRRLLDYVAMDIKASPENYEKLVGVNVINEIRQTRDLIMQSGVEYEFRTTLVREIVDAEEFKKILEFVRGASKYFLQNFETRGGCLQREFEQYHGFNRLELEEMCNQARKFVGECGVRS